MAGSVAKLQSGTVLSSTASVDIIVFFGVNPVQLASVYPNQSLVGGKILIA